MPAVQTRLPQEVYEHWPERCSFISRFFAIGVQGSWGQRSAAVVDVRNNGVCSALTAHAGGLIRYGHLGKFDLHHTTSS